MERKAEAPPLMTMSWSTETARQIDEHMAGTHSKIMSHTGEHRERVHSAIAGLKNGAN